MLEDNHLFYHANTITNNKLVIYSENVKKPMNLHFTWADDARVNNLYNKEGFPASLFRTDCCKTIKKDVKYKP